MDSFLWLMIFLLPLPSFSLILSLPSSQSVLPGASLRVQLAAEAHDPELVSLVLHNSDTGKYTILIAEVYPSDNAFVDLLVPNVPPLPNYAIQAFDAAREMIAESAHFDILPALPSTSIAPSDNITPSTISSSTPSPSSLTAMPTPTDNATSSRRPSVAAIVGTVVGGIALAAIAFIWWCLRRRCGRRTRLLPFLLPSSNKSRCPRNANDHLITVTPFTLTPGDFNPIRTGKRGAPLPWISEVWVIGNDSDVESCYSAEKQLMEVEYTRQILEDEKQRTIALIERPVGETRTQGLKIAVPSTIRPGSTVSMRTSMSEDGWELEYQYQLEILRAEVRQLPGSLALTEPPPPIYTPTNGRGTGVV